MNTPAIEMRLWHLLLFILWIYVVLTTVFWDEPYPCFEPKIQYTCETNKGYQLDPNLKACNKWEELRVWDNDILQTKRRLIHRVPVTSTKVAHLRMEDGHFIWFCILMIPWFFVICRAGASSLPEYDYDVEVLRMGMIVLLLCCLMGFMIIVAFTPACQL